MINAAEISETEGGYILIVSRITSDERKFGGRLGGLRGSPDDVWSFYGSVWQVIDGGQLRNVQNKTMIGELAHFIGVKVFILETAASEFKAVEVGRIILFESTNKGLHIELGADLVLTEVDEANFNFVAEFSGFFFGLGDAGFVTFGKFGCASFIAATFRRTNERPESLAKPSPVNKAAFFASFDGFDPFVGDLFVPIIRNRASENLDPEFPSLFPSYFPLSFLFSFHSFPSFQP